MSIKVESTSDSKELVDAVNADATETVETKVEPTKSASSKKDDETADESETSETDSEKEELEASSGDDESPEDKGNVERKTNNVQKRINKLTRKAADKEREAEYWKAEALKHQSKSQPADDPKVEAKADTTGKPNEDDFDSNADYVEAMADWKAEQKLKERDSKARESQLKEDYQSKVTTFQTNVKTFKESVEDFEDVISDVDDVQMSAAVQDLLLSSDNGPELMYELAKNKDEYKRICELSPIAAARALGAFESRLSKKETIETKTTKAPKPVTPVTAKSASATKKSIYDPNISQKDFERLRAEQMAGR